MATHQEIDQRSLELHRLVAEKIRRDPTLLDRARRTLTRWRKASSVRTDPYLDEGMQLLDTGGDGRLAVALEKSERAAALRQSWPLSCLLSPPERCAFCSNGERIMQRHELDHSIRTASAITNDHELLIMDSQLILGAVALLPSSLTVSMEAGIYQADMLELTDLIDGSIGEVSALSPPFCRKGDGVGSLDFHSR